MATKYTLTTTFTAITEGKGTIQNVGNEAVELVSSTNAAAGEGIVLLPGEKRTYKGSISARSLGDAGSDVNVVDFTEAAEGGDVMTGATATTDGTSGLVPPPTAGNENRFLRGDGTWAVPTDEDTQYQPATQLADGLMSATDKTNLDNIEANYRQPSTSYIAGQIAYHTTLPTGYYLECTTPGTTGSGALTISNTGLGKLVTDGTVAWAINNIPTGITNHNDVERGVELPYTWSEIKAKAQAGDFSNIYIGDYKTMTLAGGETVVCEVAGIDQYYKCTDQEIGHHIDFISRDCLAGGRRMNDTNTNNGTSTEKHPWLASELYTTLNDETNGVYEKLPSDLKSTIITKRALLEERYSAGGAVSADTGWSWANVGKLWLLTEVEVFGHHTWSEPGYGTGGGGCNLQYPIFQGGAKHIIKGDGNGGSRCLWWELSAYRVSTAEFCAVNSAGNANGAGASYINIRVPLCFRIG